MTLHTYHALIYLGEVLGELYKDQRIHAAGRHSEYHLIKVITIDTRLVQGSEYSMPLLHGASVSLIVRYLHDTGDHCEALLEFHGVAGPQDAREKIGAIDMLKELGWE